MLNYLKCFLIFIAITFIYIPIILIKIPKEMVTILLTYTLFYISLINGRR